MGKLLEGDRPTLALLKTNPFPDHPPRWVRAELCQYRFTTVRERKRTGTWWTREFVRPYFPKVSLETEGLRRIFQEEYGR